MHEKNIPTSKIGASEKDPQGVSDNDLESQLGSEIRHIGIPPRPLIIDRIHSEMHKEEPDYFRLAEIIGSDVGLSASVIKVTNSPYFGIGKRIRSVSEALMVLGLRVTINSIAGLALQRAFPLAQNLERFWDSAARTARVSGWLALRLRGRIAARPDDAYTIGLFRDCGIPVLMRPFPEYLAILRQANSETSLPFTVVEDQRVSINHAIIGAEMAEDWLLPQEICEAVRYHHDLAIIAAKTGNAVSEVSRQLIAIVQLSEHLIQTHTGLSQTREWGKLGSACTQLLDISAAELDVLLEMSCEAVSGSD